MPTDQYNESDAWQDRLHPLLRGWRSRRRRLPARTVPHRPSPAGADKSSTEDLEGKAKRLFVAGKYAEAIDILARLYTETGNPIYLRNIGRCYQRLRDVDRAIASFEEYLLRAKNISKAEREEVQGFVRELEELKRRNAAAARPRAGADGEGARCRPASPAPSGPSR